MFTIKQPHAFFSPRIEKRRRLIQKAKLLAVQVCLLVGVVGIAALVILSPYIGQLIAQK